MYFRNPYSMAPVIGALAFAGLSFTGNPIAAAASEEPVLKPGPEFEQWRYRSRGGKFKANRRRELKRSAARSFRRKISKRPNQHA